MRLAWYHPNMLRIRRARAVSGVRYGIYATVLVASLFIAHAYLSGQVHAQAESSWLHEEPVLSGDIVRQPLRPIDRECTVQYVWVVDILPLQQKCIVHSDGVSVDSRLEYVRVGNDQRYYPLTGMYGFSAPGRDYIPESDVVVARGGVCLSYLYGQSFTQYRAATVNHSCVCRREASRV